MPEEDTGDEDKVRVAGDHIDLRYAIVNGNVTGTQSDTFDSSASALARAEAKPLIVMPQRRVASDRLRGRDSLVARLTGAIAGRAGGDASLPGVWLLTGMGGCGKTTVALEAAHRLASTVPRVWWVSAANTEVLSTALRAVASAAGAHPAQFDSQHPADVLWESLGALDTPWLLVLDNADESAALSAGMSRTADGQGWLRPPPVNSLGTVLITSREGRGKRWGDWVHVEEVGMLSAVDGGEVLRDLAPEAGDVAASQKLAGNLGGLPLALDLAGSYLARADEHSWPSPLTPVTFAGYQRSFVLRLADMASDPDEELSPDERNRRAILSTWELSLDLLHRHESDLARPLLRLLSAFGPAPVPYLELIDAQLLADSGMFNKPTQFRLGETLNGLAGLKLITLERTRDGGDAADGIPRRWITMHPMVRRASLGHSDFPERALPTIRLVTALLHRFIHSLRPESSAHWPLWRVIAPHCTAVLHLISSVGEMEGDLLIEATEPALRAARYYNRLGLYGEAASELAEIVRIRAHRLGDDHPAVVVTQLDLAWSLRDSGAFDEAEQLYREVTRICEDALPEGHTYLQSAKTGRARVLRELGRYEEAEAELREVLAMRMRMAQADRARGILRIRHDLATLAFKRGRYEDAVAELRDVRAGFEELAAENDRDTLDTLDALAAGVSLVRAMRELGIPKAAETPAEEKPVEVIAEEVVQQYLTVLTPDHPDVLLARHERARLLRDREDGPSCLAQARDEFTEIWQTNENRFGPNHPDVIAARHELATVWHLLGRLDLAVEHFQAALETGRRRLGPHHPDVVQCARNLARARAELDDRAEEDAVDDAADAPDTSVSVPDRPPRPPAGDAHSPESPSGTHSSAQLLNRYLRPRLSRGGGEAGGAGYSQGGYSSRDSWQPERSATYTPASTWPFPTDDDIQRLAQGREDRALIDRLLDNERTGRRGVLLEVLRLAAEADRADGAFEVDKARGLLLQAQMERAGDAYEVLFHPSVGRWLGRALQALHDPSDGSAPREAADLLHLHTVAAAAALKAGLAFRLSVSVRDGYVVLPALGAADLRTSGADTADVVASAGHAVICAQGTEVRLPSHSDPRPPGWIPAHRVRVPVGREHLSLILDDMDPYREIDGPTPPSRLSPEDVTYWRRSLWDAGRMLGELYPERAEALTPALLSLTPRPAVSGALMTSISSSDAFGGAVISTPPDAVELAATLVHEFQHMKLNTLLDLRAFYSRDGASLWEARYYAPWRDDPRPLPGFCQGVFAFLGVIGFWRRLASATTDERLRRRAEFQMLYWREQTFDACRELLSSELLTWEGKSFIRAAWAVEQECPATVDGDVRVRALAKEAVLAHRMRWRLHHMRPHPGAVAELAAAWIAGGGPPGRAVAATTQPDHAVPQLHDYTELLCQVAVDPSLPREARTAPGGSLLDEADVARLLGETETVRRLAVGQVNQAPECSEPWARLGLALRSRAPHAPTEADSHSAAQALIHSPELVQATYLQVAQITGTLPDPVNVAQWLGRRHGT